MMNKYSIKVKVYLVMSFSLLFGQKIVNMNGTFDLDGDKMLEFISLELNPKKDTNSTDTKHEETSLINDKKKVKNKRVA